MKALRISLLAVWIIVTPLVLVGVNPCVYAQTDEDELFSTAQRAFDDGFHSVALRYLEEFLPKYPQSPKINQAKMLLGQCYYLKNDYSKALELFQSVPDIVEDKDVLFFWTGEIYLKLSNHAQARRYYQRLLDSFPASVYIPQALYSLGWSYFDQRQYGPANEFFLKLVTQFPKHQLNEDAFLKIAQCIYNAGDYAMATNAFEQYLSRYPQSEHAPEVYLNIGDAYYYVEDFSQAITAYEKAAKTATEPRLTQVANIGKIWCLIKKKLYDQAEKAIKDSMEFAKQKKLPAEDLFLVLGQLLYEKGDWEKAVAAYDDLIKNFPAGSHRLEAYLGRGNAYYFLKKYAEAIHDFKFILDHRQPGSDKDLIGKANLGLGWAYIKTNAVDEGIKCFRDVYEHGDADVKVNALMQMADAYQEAGMFNDAIALYEQSLKDSPDSAWADYMQYR